MQCHTAAVLRKVEFIAAKLSHSKERHCLEAVVGKAIQSESVYHCIENCASSAAKASVPGRTI